MESIVETKASNILQFLHGLRASCIIVSLLRSGSARVCKTRQAGRCQPWFYPRLVAYRYFWLSEGA